MDGRQGIARAVDRLRVQTVGWIGAGKGRVVLGSIVKGSFIGPRYTDVDGAIARNFPIKESVVLQFRAEYFNLFNHINFGDPTTSLGGSFGEIPEPLRKTALLRMILESLSSRSNFSSDRTKPVEYQRKTKGILFV